MTRNFEPARKPSSAEIRLLIVDGHPLVRWALAHMADDAPDLQPVGESATAAEGLRLAHALKPDVVTIDCTAPDGSGWRLARELRDRYADLGIVILTAAGADDLMFRALESGASAFLCNSASVQEIVGAIRHAAVSASSFSARGLAQALRRRGEATSPLALSGRERQVLALLQDGRSVPEVAATLFVSLSTAKTYVARLYDKLGANNRAQALMTAVQLGLFDGHYALAAG
jgi:DNA-binding NarL/FixJ family response regulator